LAWQKDICPIEAKATRKNHRHPIRVVKARRKVVGMTISAAVVSVNARYRLFERIIIISPLDVIIILYNLYHIK
jgi:hypothetical protein